MTNLSRIPKFDVHTVVTGPFRGVGVVDRNTGAESKGEDEWCHVRIRVDGNVEVHKFNEGNLHRASFWRFLFWRNPDGTLQVGYNPLWAFLLCCLAVPATWYFLRGEPDPYSWTLRAVLTATPILWLIFTGRQYLGLTR
jgi:hypothetical protein